MGIRKQIILTVVSLAAIAALGTAAYRYKQSQLQTAKQTEAAKQAPPPRILSEFTVLEKIKLVSPEKALGHQFNLQDDKGSHYSVALYFVESPPTELNDDTSMKIARLARYFGNVPLEKLLEIGTKAREFTLQQLHTRPFRLATLFYPTKNHSGFHGFILLRGEGGEEFYLSELLVKNGLASITAEGGHLPYGERRSVFRNYLIGLERKARADKLGIWAYSRSPTEGGATEDPAGTPAP